MTEQQLSTAQTSPAGQVLPRSISPNVVPLRKLSGDARKLEQLLKLADTVPVIEGQTVERTEHARMLMRGHPTVEPAKPLYADRDATLARLAPDHNHT